MAENVLKVENVTMQFGGVVAVDNMNLSIDKGEIVALIGPNGAGKTTAFNVVTGVYQPTNGAVWFQGEKIVENHPQGKMRAMYKGEHAGEYTHVIAPTPDRITQLGMARTFQNIRLWKSQTVFDNVLIAKHCRTHTNFLSAKLVSDVCCNLINICVVTLNSCYDGFCNTNNVSVADYKFSCLFSTENHISNDFFQVISFSDDWSPQAS